MRWFIPVIMTVTILVMGCTSVRPNPATVPDGYDVDLTPGCEGEVWL